MQMEVRKLTVGYGAAWVLDQVSLQIGAGEFVGIVGCTGCGKTTVINLLMRFYDVNSGSISVEDVDIREMTRHSLRAGYAWYCRIHG